MTAPRPMMWASTQVAGRAAQYGVAGLGRPVLFLHGWGLSARAYREPLELLVVAGVRVYAPSMPGFGGTAPLPGEVGIGCYARWVAEFITAARIPGPVTVIGHSFGGGVAIRLAHDTRGLVEQLIPINCVGAEPMAGRPLWEWGFKLRAEVDSRRSLRSVPRIVRESVPNIVRNPVAVWQSANLARFADLRAELVALRRRGLPITVAWGEHDQVIPPSSLDALLASLGGPSCVRVPGRHGWPIDEPELFAEVVLGVLAPEVPGVAA